MLKVFLSLISMFVLANASYYERANSASAAALDGLDCEFEDCKKEEPKPKVIIKEKIVEKIVEKPVERVVIKEVPVVKETPKQVVAAPSGDIQYNKAFFDVYSKSQAPMLDYIDYKKRSSFDVEQFVDTVSKIKERGARAEIHGSLQVPSSITTDQVYIYNGKKYFHNYYGSWTKKIFYNGNNIAQNADYFLVDVKTDLNGARYVDYKIVIGLSRPWEIKPSEENVAPNTYLFKMAPKTRGFKNKFIPAKPYIKEE